MSALAIAPAPVLVDSPLFRGLSPRQLAAIDAIAQRRRLARGEYVFRAGEPSREVFVIAAGAAEIVKEDAPGGQRHALLALGVGACLGEAALEDGAPRAVAARATEDSELLCLPVGALRALEAHDAALGACLRLNVARQAARDFRALADVTVSSLRERLAIAQAHERSEIFVITMLVVLCAYVFVLQVGAQFVHGRISTSLLSIPGFIVFFALFYRAVRRSGQPIAAYGVTLLGWRRSLAEGVAWSLPLMAVTVGVKWLLVTFHPALRGEPVIVFPANLHADTAGVLVEAAAYIAFSPFQEFIVRGAMQGSLEQFLTGPRRLWHAILIANLMYAMLHLYMSVIFSVMVFLPGLTWGWLYSRHRTLVGVTVSHALCGLFAFFIVGFDTLIRIYR